MAGIVILRYSEGSGFSSAEEPDASGYLSMTRVSALQPRVSHEKTPKRPGDHAGGELHSDGGGRVLPVQHRRALAREAGGDQAGDVPGDDTRGRGHRR